MMKKLFAFLFLISIAIFGFIAAQPYWVASQIGDAIETKDTAKLAEHIDFVQVRAHVTPRIKAEIKQRIESGIQENITNQLPIPASWATKLSDWSKPYVDRLSDAYIGQLVQQSVDTVLTPQGVMNVIAGIERLPTNNNGSSWQSRVLKNTLGIDATEHDDNVTVGYENKDRFIVSKAFQVPQYTLHLVMTRQGYTWRVTDIQMYENQ